MYEDSRECISDAHKCVSAVLRLDGRLLMNMKFTNALGSNAVRRPHDALPVVKSCRKIDRNDRESTHLVNLFDGKEDLTSDSGDVFVPSSSDTFVMVKNFQKKGSKDP